MRGALIFLLTLLSLPSLAQVDMIMIPAGTPADQAIQTISSETDPAKKIALYEDFLEKFSSDPAAVAFGNWQISQSYQTSGELEKALSYGDKALAAQPHNLDILMSQANIAQQMKLTAKAMGYATTGGKAYNNALHQTKPEGMNEKQFAANMASLQETGKNAYEFLESAAFNAIVDEKDDKTRMGYIERFTPAFPGSRFDESVTQYAMYSLGQLNDSARLFAYGEKALVANPNSQPTMLLLANAYLEDPKLGSLPKAISYSQKVVALAKADAPDADRSRKLSGGAAHSTLGWAYIKQEKTAAAIPELKIAAELLKGQDDTSYANALYRLGYAYGKANRLADARTTLEEAVKIPGPLQGPSRELLNRVNSAHAKAK